MAVRVLELVEFRIAEEGGEPYVESIGATEVRSTTLG